MHNFKNVHFFIIRVTMWLYEWQCRPVCRSVYHFSPHTGWIATEVCADIHGPQGMNPRDIGDPLTFPPVSPAGLHFDRNI